MPSLMLIFSFYIAICSQGLRIILYQPEKRYLLKEKHFKKKQVDNTLKLLCYHTDSSSVINIVKLISKWQSYNLFYGAESTYFLNGQEQGRLKENTFYR